MEEKTVDYSWNWQDDGCASGNMTCTCGHNQDVFISSDAVECEKCHKKYKAKWVGMVLE